MAANLPFPMVGSALFDRSRRLRYRLSRCWNARRPSIAFVLLNPSTADSRRNDPTVRRCIGFAQRWGYGRLEVVNLFALRATHVVDLREAARRFGARFVIGPENNRHLMNAVRSVDRVVAAWGVHGALHERGARVLDLFERRTPGLDLHCLGQTTEGFPRHPLYLRSATRSRRLAAAS